MGFIDYLIIAAGSGIAIFLLFNMAREAFSGKK